jgi:hypothetical protein
MGGGLSPIVRVSFTQPAGLVECLAFADRLEISNSSFQRRAEIARGGCAVYSVLLMLLRILHIVPTVPMAWRHDAGSTAARYACQDA